MLEISNYDTTDYRSEYSLDDMHGRRFLSSRIGGACEAHEIGRNGQ